jgi:hypothetical protein
MGFEIFSRKIQRGGSPRMSFTTHGRLAFNNSATALFEKNAVENVLLLWDAEKRLIGIRPITKKDGRAYKVRYYKKGNGCGFSAVTFLKYIGYNREGERQSLPAKWDEQEQMLVIEVPEEILQKEKQQVIPLISGKRQTKQS